MLDEADTLLDMGFRADVEQIVEKLPSAPQRQTFLFSATVSPAINNIARQSLDPNHAFIDCVAEDDSPVHAHIPQHCTVVSPEQQFPHLATLIAQDQLKNAGQSKIIVFFGTTKATMLTSTLLDDIRRQLPDTNTQVYELHSRLSQEKRRRVSDKFRNHSTGSSVLVTSDVSARGIDYPNVTRVIQVGIPPSREQYIHRVGRTGRGNNLTGRGDLIALPFEEKFISRNLGDVPIEKLKHDDVFQEVIRLADAYDQNPTPLVKSKNLSAQRSRFSTGFGKGVRARLEALPAAARGTLEDRAPEDMEEVYTSLLGCYTSMANEVGMDKMGIYKALRDACPGTLGIEPPKISDTMLTRMGINVRASKSSFEGRSSGGFGSRPSFQRASDRPRERRNSEWLDAPRWGGRDGGRDGGRTGSRERRSSFSHSERDRRGGSSFRSSDGDFSRRPRRDTRMNFD